MLDPDRVAGDARSMRGLRDGAKGFFGIFLHACFVSRRRVLISIIWVSVVNV
jgi:hypothetical protein